MRIDKPRKPDANLIGIWYRTAATSLTDSPMNRAGVAAALEVVMPRSGSISGLTAQALGACTAGTATFKVFKNGVYTGISARMDTANPQFVYSATEGAVLFVAGDRLDIRVSSSSDYAPTSFNSWDASIFVEFD